jgi:hypothetical protein
VCKFLPFSNAHSIGKRGKNPLLPVFFDLFAKNFAQKD